MIRRRTFTTELPDLSGVMVWLSVRGLKPKAIADILTLPAGTVRVALLRERKGIQRIREGPLLQALDNRLNSTNRAAFPKAIREAYRQSGRSNILSIEGQIRHYVESFHEGVPFLSGTAELGEMLQKVSGPAARNFSRLRMQARLYTLEAETYLHGGYATSALDCGLQAHGLWEWLYKETSNAFDLEQLAKTILVISNACISRRDTKRAGAWLDLAKEAFDSSNSVRRLHPDPEYLRQRASIARSAGDIEEARKKLEQARTELPFTVPEATKEQLNGMADRVLNVIADSPRWDESRRLLDEAAAALPDRDSHLASYLLWTVSCGLQTDSPGIRNEALSLLSERASSAAGFGLQSTGAYLLALTPRIPKDLQKSWAMFAISYNAYSGK